MIDVIFWASVVYVVDVYWIIRYVREVQEDLRDGQYDYPMRGWTLVD